MYWAVDGAMAAANIERLSEAAETCGAGPFAIVHRVVLPNIGTGIATGAMLVFATSFGEFALVQMLAGRRFETVSLWSLDLLTGTNARFNELAVITVVTFALLFLISVISVYLNRGQTIRLLPGGRALERR
jgi:putative spermidine/putrescine transport system permease protein